MNPKNNSYRGAGSSLVTATINLTNILFLIALFAICAALLLPQVARADNYNSYYLNTTSSIVVPTVSTNPANVVLANSTNYFNLSTTSGATNNPLLWPACPITKQDNMYNPSRILTHQVQSASVAANVGNWTERIAGSTDGAKWQTNPCPIILTTTQTGTTMAGTGTNLDSGGWQYFSVFSRENTNASVAITNTYDGDGFNRGL